MDYELGGTYATPGRYPYIAQIYVDDGSNSGYCTGMLITPWLVLTAAHCFYASSTTLSVKKVYVFVGEGGNFDYYADEKHTYEQILASIGSNVVHRGVQKIVWPGGRNIEYGIAHTKGQEQLLGNAAGPNNDFALVVLDSPVTTVRPVKVSGFTVPSVNLKKGMPLVSLGYGTDSSSGGSPKSLKSNTFRLSAVGTPYIGIVSTSTNTCEGDSGGPLLIQGATAADDAVVAITNNGTGSNCVPSKSDAYYMRTDAMNSIDHDVSTTLKTYATAPSTTAPATTAPSTTAPSTTTPGKKTDGSGLAGGPTRPGPGPGPGPGLHPTTRPTTGPTGLGTLGGQLGILGTLGGLGLGTPGGQSLEKAGGETGSVGGQLLLSSTGEVIDGRPKTAVPTPNPGPVPTPTPIIGPVVPTPAPIIGPVPKPGPIRPVGPVQISAITPSPKTPAVAITSSPTTSAVPAPVTFPASVPTWAWIAIASSLAAAVIVIAMFGRRK